MAPSVRQATLGDRALLAELARRTFLATYGPDNDADDLERYVDEAFSEARLDEQLADPDETFLLIEEAPTDGRSSPAAGPTPVGYAHLRPGSTPAVQGADPVELVRIYVEHHLTGSGYGGRLLQAAVDGGRRRGHDTLWLGVWEHNLAAQRFYAWWGFRTVGEVRFVLGGDVQTDRIMSRPLALPDPDSPRRGCSRGE